jgi:translation elongation factor EF-Tu-like GTPase
MTPQPEMGRKEISMPKSKTHFPQVPIEVAEKVAELELPGSSAPVREDSKKKKLNGHDRTDAGPDELLEIRHL